MSEERIPEAWAWEKPVAGGTWMTDVRIGWGKPSPDATKFNLRPLYSDPDGAEKELSALRTQNAEQAERIRELERLVTSQGISSMEDLDENQQLRAEVERLKSQLISIAYVDEVPQVQQGEPNHEVLELLDAETVRGFITSIERLTRERDTARNSDEHNFNRWQRDAEQLAAAQKDADRLDWMFDNPVEALDIFGNHHKDEKRFVRGTIDAAMRGKEGE